MPRKTPLTIDPSYYTGRNFTPTQEVDLRAVTHPGPIQADLGPNGMLVVNFKADTPLVSVSIAPYPVPANSAQQRIVSIGKKGDFSSGARAGHDTGIQGRVGATGRAAETYVPLVAGAEYFINVANAYPDAVGGNMRVQVSFSA